MASETDDEPVRKVHHRGKVFRDPVHSLITVNPDEGYLLDLIDAPEFQRLRRVRQLGVSSITYPGAEHTRFSHSLGVLHFAGRILGRLKERYRSHDEISEIIGKNERVIRAAALLHDTGHGPFSHMIERAFPSTADHEKKTGEIITSEEFTVAQRLRDHGIDPAEVRAVIAKTFPYKFLNDIVSSQLDADRMDYLLRDSLMTGVAYGRYDAEWILNCLCLGLEPDLNVPEDSRNLRLCLDDKRGMYAAEQLIVARMHMSLQVYFHRVTRGWEAHLLCLFEEAAKLAADDTGGLPAATPETVLAFFANKGATSASDFLRFDEVSCLAAFHAWAEAKEQAGCEWLGELAERFLLRSKVFHAVEFPRDPIGKSYETILKLKELGAEENRHWHHDRASFRGYKDFGSVFGKTVDEDQEYISTDSILLNDGSPKKRASPVERDSRTLAIKAIGLNESLPLNRVFVHDTYHSQLS